MRRGSGWPNGAPDPRTGAADSAHTGEVSRAVEPVRDEPPGGARSAGPVLLGWGLAASCLGAAAAGVGISVGSGEPVPWRFLLIPVIWAVPSALIAAARPRALLGWVNLVVAVLFSAVGLARAWLPVGGADHPALATLAIWYVDRGGALIVPAITVGLVLLPNSRLPGPRWRLPVAAAVAVQLVLIAMWSLSATAVGAPDSQWPPHLASRANPLGVLPAAAAGVADRLVWLLQLPLLVCVAAMVVRVRRSSGAERQGLVSLLLGLVVLVAVILSGRSVLGPYAGVVDVLAGLLMAGVLVSAVLRRHLEGVSVVVHQAFVLAVLGAVVVALYVLAVATLSAAGPDLSRFGAGVVAALAALAVHPLRARLQRWVDRLMHGDRKDPFAAVSRLADSAHRAPSLTVVLERVAASVATSLRVPQVQVEAFGQLGRHPAAVSQLDPGPGRAGALDGEHREAPTVDTAARAVAVPLLAGDREVGSLVAVPQVGRRLGGDELRLLGELGRHAGVAVDAVHLAEQVAEHHRAVVGAREEERRRLGRELHDELGPTVAGLSMQLGALRPLVRTDPDAVVARLARLEAAAAGALADIRRVAHDLRPPVLDQVGLGRAVRQVAESLDLVLVEDVVEPDALPAAVELAAYRIAAEALTNVARHAGTRAVRLGVRTVGDALVVTVADDGCGPGPAADYSARHTGGGSHHEGAPSASASASAEVGLGMATMRERAEELGGTFSVRPGECGGTAVTAVLPLVTPAPSALRGDSR